MNIVITSDQHHNLMSDPYDLKEHKERALRMALEATLRADIGVDAGDLFDYTNPSTSTVSWVTRIYSEVLGTDIGRQIFTIGNHGESNREESPMEGFANGCKCYNDPPLIVGRKPLILENIMVHGWNSNEPLEITDNVKYMIKHARIREWVFNTNERAFSKSEFDLPNLQRVVLGDNHSRRDEGKLISVGALCPKDFKDKDVRAGFIVLDTDHNEYRRIDVPNYPIFREIVLVEGAEFEPRPEYIKGNIIRFKRIGSHKFVNDKVDQAKWKSLIWSMQPHYIAEILSTEIVKPVLIELCNEELIPIDDEIKQAAQEQDWPEESLNVALRA